jgi:glucose/arabinose dehydrogenase
VAPDAASVNDARGPAIADAAADLTNQPDTGPDAPIAAPSDGGPAAGTFCALGSDVAGAVVPDGFCLRRFATVLEARTIAFARNGDLFVGAPSKPTAGGASNGPGAILVLSDDNHDGVAEEHTFAAAVSDVHGLAVGPDFVYFTTTTDVWRTPYATGQRLEAGVRESMGMPEKFGSGGRWAHGLALSRSGVLFASHGEYSTCGSSPGPGGEIATVAMGATQVVATGFRNPMYLRCHSSDEVCAATELGEDNMTGAREKLVGLRPGTNFGYPCCYTTDLAVPGSMAPGGACAPITHEDAAFVLSDTPFGFDWERGVWPASYRGAIFVALHGSFYSMPPWSGARIVFARTDPTTHMPVEGWQDFVRGFGPESPPLERPSDVAFAPDGRMFFSDDHGGGVYWVAPSTLRPN